MSTLDEVSGTLRSVLSDVDGFATAITLTDPDGDTYDISGLWQDIGLVIDPETGVAVHGRKASVAVSIAVLTELGLSLPEGIPEEDLKPWLATKGSQTFKVVGTSPDSLGCVVLDLVAYRT